jgi:hypothetical protein
MKLRTFGRFSTSFAAILFTGLLISLIAQKDTGWRTIALLLFIIGGLGIVFLRLIWFKCPKCHKYLGKMFKLHCTHCGCAIVDKTDLG